MNDEHHYLLFIATCNLLPPGLSWKTYKDGLGVQVEDGWFLAGLNLPNGAIVCYLPADLWTLMNSPQWAKAPLEEMPSRQAITKFLKDWLLSTSYNPATPREKEF